MATVHRMWKGAHAACCAPRCQFSQVVEDVNEVNELRRKQQDGFLYRVKCGDNQWLTNQLELCASVEESHILVNLQSHLWLAAFFRGRPQGAVALSAPGDLALHRRGWAL